MDDVSDIRDMYNAGWEIEDSRLERHQLERDITWRYLDTYLPPSGRILEIGAGTGQYTQELARRGYDVLAVDVAPNLVARATERAAAAGLSERIKFRVGDARSLAGVPEDAFDAVLLMGPLYHLVVRQDRLLALERAFACLKPGTVLFSALLSRFGILGDCLKRTPHWIERDAEVRSIMAHGRDPEDRPGKGFRGYFATFDEIAPLHEQAGFETLVLAGAEPAISADDESYNRLEGKRRRLWLDLLFNVSAEPSLVASSRHLLYIGRKPKRGPVQDHARA